MSTFETDMVMSTMAHYSASCLKIVQAGKNELLVIADNPLDLENTTPQLVVDALASQGLIVEDLGVPGETVYELTSAGLSHTYNLHRMWGKNGRALSKPQ